MKKVTIVGLAAVLVFGLGAGASQAADAVVGEKAPDFELSDTNGDSHKLSDFQDEYVVLEWLNHDCPFVRKHYDSGNMQELQKKYTDADVVWLSICSSAPGKQGHYEPEAANKLTVEKKALPTAVLVDEEGTVGRLYGAKVTPHMYVIDPEGTLIYQGAIDDIPSPRKEDVAKANNYVAAALDASMAGEPVARTSSKAYGCSVKYK